jgi:hypothetical protein
MISPSFGVRTAFSLCGAIGVLSALHFYWAFGGAWGLAAALGRQEIDSTIALRLGAGAVAIALLVAAASVLGRVGIWGGFLPLVLFSWATWVIAAAFFLAALVNLISLRRGGSSSSSHRSRSPSEFWPCSSRDRRGHRLVFSNGEIEHQGGLECREDPVLVAE